MLALEVECGSIFEGRENQRKTLEGNTKFIYIYVVLFFFFSEKKFPLFMTKVTL